MFSLRTLLLATAALGLGGLGVASAASGPARREMTTDRPDATESPFTVEPGHVQLELDFLNYGRDREAGVRSVAWEAVPFNLRFGLAPDFEAGFFMVPFQRVSATPSAGPRMKQNGFGDVTLRSKLNLWGNDGGNTAFAAIADLKLPTASGGLGNGKFEGAVTFPLAFGLAGGWEGGAMTSLGLAHDGTSYQSVWDNTVTFGHELARNVGGFLELTSSTGAGSHVATFNCGVTLALGRDTQLDGGINVGLSRSAPDLQLFAGWSRRF